ncbi:putative outer membrane starch-binding protein [Mucilaginibacter gracilis]|uniref:Putative outer membrane starch-binding protein n=1 Tax=Mucilaginibacter gracilis TaxID=423350 RepID=A0A495J5S4_9SPHI|nr:RagB/SusD family nutrient uptake outer membrane protein [Mucilaginibacter gracilis]RKR84340.1 putative outer membrane starch-binding protein [Mucilaginibacter gracilis]
MKKNSINKRKIGLLLVVLGILGMGCKKSVLEQVNPNAIDASLFNSASAANEFVNNIYTLAAPAWPLPTAVHNSTDEFYNSTTTELYGQLTVESVTDISGTGTTSFYYIMYQINAGIQGIEQGTLDAATKAQLKGQLYYFRAYMYFNAIKLYGGVPLVLKPFNLITDNLLIPRSKTSDCVKQIASDLDSCYALPARWSLSTDGGRVTKDAALALKGKVLMYWASPQFNPNNADPTRWEPAYQACELAYTTALADGYKLMTNYSQIFTDETASNTERIFWRTYDITSISPTHGNNIESLTRPYSETISGGGSYQPTWNLVQAYGTFDGLPITDPQAVSVSGYDSELWWLKRDPRLAASIAYNGCVWNLSGKTNRLQWNYTGMLDDNNTPTKTGFYCRKFNIISLSPAAAVYNSNSGGGSGIDFNETRFAEVLLNAAEAANGSDRFAEAQTLLVSLRQARGLSAGSFNYGVAKITSKDQMFTELWREREVEFAIEGKRYDDLRRTRQFDKLSGTTRQSFFCAAKSPYVAGSGSVAGKIYLDVADPVTLVKPRDLINVNVRAQYEQYFTTAVASLETNSSTPVISWPTNYYFFAFPTAFISTDIKLQQTIGWPNGVFDPTK